MVSKPFTQEAKQFKTNRLFPSLCQGQEFAQVGAELEMVFCMRLGLGIRMDLEERFLCTEMIRRVVLELSQDR